ncbi:hypothetical protein ACQVQT_00455 [Bacillus paranthracis]|uniref:Uncharacterized protein n=1 Tax=Bacillus paranthracis TaxID=2026186 RepID=A0A5M9H5P6_9BACI|nr:MULTISPECIES: hypothetical protein [Bacillus cereus group]KXI40964.1 hypothetical protein ACS53_12230 [Bacillus cereus]MBQ6447798.1 hypothetical protein [Bacillus sp. (in: firmicutes)]CUB51178.1 hypothetical protein BN2127_JRS10_00695 [Bacillus subtilis]KAA8481211.1 hypothetical protein FYW06_05240 [Bacillus paranthracis]KXI58362.1 hypothetical protein ACS48_17595 [Bacillus cereus]
MIDTDKVSEFLQTAERLNASLMEINESIDALKNTDNVLQLSIFHKKFNGDLPLSKLESVDEKNIDFNIRPTVLAYLKDQKKFLESELQNLLSKQIEGGNE